MSESKFDGMGKVYSMFRPTYPKDFIEYLYSSVGINENSTIADIGSGTGILTKQLLEKGNRVFAVEPNDDMRVVAEANLSGFARLTSVKGTGENTTLDAGSIDFITVAQAFHWFDRVKFMQECNRVLKPNGKVILVWNSRVFNAEMVKDTDAVHKKFCRNFKGFTGGIRGGDEHDFRDFFKGKYESKVFRNDLTFELDGFIGRNLSASYALKENEENYTSYIEELKESFNKHAIGGKLVMPNVTKSYVGTV